MNKEKNTQQANAKRRYLDNIRTLVDTHEKKTQQYISLAFTFTALIIFSLFAISPTFSTILKLQRQLEDRKLLLTQLDTKLANLGTLQQKYEILKPDLPLINAAIPIEPTTNYFLAELQALVKNNAITLSELEAREITLTETNQNTTIPFSFTIDAKGSYDNLQKLLAEVINFDRITSISSAAFSRSSQDANDENAKDTDRTLHIEGQAYYRE